MRKCHIFRPDSRKHLAYSYGGTTTGVSTGGYGGDVVYVAQPGSSGGSTGGGHGGGEPVGNGTTLGALLSGPSNRPTTIGGGLRGGNLGLGSIGGSSSGGTSGGGWSGRGTTGRMGSG